MTVLPRLINDSVIEFDINNADSYLELNKTEIEIKFRIKKEGETNLTTEDHVGTIDYTIATLISSVEVKLNSKTITYCSSNYAERSIMEILMKYTSDSVNSWLATGLFEKETAARMNASNPNASNDVVNGGLKARAKYVFERE